MAELTFFQKLAHNEVWRRILGAMLTVFAPGAGHVVIGYRKIGTIIAAGFCVLFVLLLVGAVTVTPALFLCAFAIGTFLYVPCVISVFAVPPGPDIKRGAAGVIPAFVIAALFRAATIYAPAHIVGVVPVPDDSLAPAVKKGDTMLVHPGSVASIGDVVLFAKPDDKLDFRRMGASTPTERIRGRALFVLASGSGDGRGRIWKPLRK